MDKRKSNEIKNYLETNQNENTAFQNVWDEAKTVLREFHSYADISQKKKNEKFQVNNLTLHLNQLEKKKEIGSKQKERNS